MQRTNRSREFAMVECSKCGHANPSGSNFCSRCGERLTGTVSGDTTTVIPAATANVEEESTRLPEISAEDAAAVNALPKGHALLIVTRGPDIGARYLLDAEVTTAGRSPNTDIFLDDITVSRQHAKFLMQDGKVIVEDQGSLNGTYVNRTLVDGSAVLRPGDEVQVGKFRMTFFVSEHGLR